VIAAIIMIEIIKSDIKKYYILLGVVTDGVVVVAATEHVSPEYCDGQTHT
jgi:hypothetical protein